MKLLIINELIKIRRQTAFRIISIIFAVLIVLIPLGSMLLTKATTLIEITDNDWYAEYAEKCREDGDWAGYVSYRSYVQCDDLFTASGLSEKSFEYELYYYPLRMAVLTKDSVELLISGKYADITDLAQTPYELGMQICSLFTETFPEIAENLPADELYGLCKAISPFLTKERLQTLYLKATSDLLEIQNRIRTFDLAGYYAESVETERQSIENLKITVETLKENLKIAPDTEKPGIEDNIRMYEKAVEIGDDIIRARQHLLENESEYGGWEYTTVTGLIIPALEQLPTLTDMTEELYADNPRQKGLLSDKIMTYKEYLADNESRRNSTETAVRMGFDSLESGIPLKKALPDSPKARWQSQVTTCASLATTILIVLAGTTMSSEYSSGSVRLLLIRPKKRGKILCSKILAMLIYWIILMMTAYVVLFLLNLIGGPGDLFKPDISVIGGRIIHVNSFIAALAIMLEDMLSASVYVMFALLMSLLIRKAALAIALPILARDAASTIQYGCILLRSVFGKWVTWLPFAYSELSYFRADPTSDYLMGSGSLSDLISQVLSYSLVKDFRLWYGVICAAAIAGLYTLLCFTTFKKQQIKN